MTTFRIDTPDRSKVDDAMKAYPEAFAKYFSQAINAALAFLSRTAANDSIMQFKTPRSQRTGYLQLSFDLGLRAATSENLQGSIGPTANYAIMVHDGTKPHEIRNAWGRKGLTVHHPGTAANPFMERIIAASQGNIDAVFEKALQLTIRGINV